MLSIFSNTNKKTSDIIQELKHCSGSLFIRDLLGGPADEPLYMLKPKAIFVLCWINRKILFELPNIKTGKDARWIGVRIRIATGMINKLEENNIITKDTAITYHERLVKNVRRIVGEIYTEDLPF